MPSAKKNASPKRPKKVKSSEIDTLSKSVSLDRAARLCRLIEILAEDSRTRKFILQKLKIDIRTFYRDLELLRECRIQIDLERRKYVLATPKLIAKERLPFPDPGLTLGEAEILAKGRSQIHKKLRKLLQTIKS